MAGDWIKMGVGLRTHPKVVRMASALRADRLRVVGGLHAAWSIFDAHTEDGFLEGYTHQAIDEDLGWRGFAAAMAAVGWLESREDGLHVPDYAEHNGATAKRRAMESRRKEAARDGTKAGRMSAWRADKTRMTSGQLSASDADNLRAREEKRREEKDLTTCAPSDPEKPDRPAPKVVLNGSGFEIPTEIAASWRKAYPAVDVDAEVAKAYAWTLANPKNRKANWARFLVNWLAKAQERAPVAPKSQDWRDDPRFRGAI